MIPDGPGVENSSNPGFNKTFIAGGKVEADGLADGGHEPTSDGDGVGIVEMLTESEEGSIVELLTISVEEAMAELLTASEEDAEVDGANDVDAEMRDEMEPLSRADESSSVGVGVDDAELLDGSLLIATEEETSANDETEVLLAMKLLLMLDDGVADDSVDVAELDFTEEEAESHLPYPSWQA